MEGDNNNIIYNSVKINNRYQNVNTNWILNKMKNIKATFTSLQESCYLLIFFWLFDIF